MVRVVTDSCSDVDPQLARELGITVVPLYVQFGKETYRDTVDLTTEEFYRELETAKIQPTTATASPAHFAQVFTESAEESKDIMAITLSEKFGAICATAMQGKAMVGRDCRVEVVDSRAGAGAQMLLVIAAAKMAQSGANLDELTDWIKRAIPKAHVRMTFDTLEYLRRGGRVGKAQAFLGGLLRVNPVLSVKDGDAFPIARCRNRAQAVDFLVDFVKGFGRIEAAAIEDATTPEELDLLARRLKDVVPAERTYRSKASPVVGAHVGPHVLAVSVLEAL
jgi:DegV family protein with EDD domain